MKANPVWIKDLVEAFDDVRMHVEGTAAEQHWDDWCREAGRRLRVGVRDLRANMPGVDELDAHLSGGVASMSWDAIKFMYHRGPRDQAAQAFRAAKGT